MTEQQETAIALAAEALENALNAAQGNVSVDFKCTEVTLVSSDHRHLKYTISVEVHRRIR